MKMPIIEGLKKYIDENNIRFHMPGHKGKDSLGMWQELVPFIDVTEVEGTDNLHKPQGIILQSQILAAKTFGAKRTLYSVNGTTGGIYAAISAVTSPGDKILIQRDCHRAVYNAIILGGLKAKYIFPHYSKKDNILIGVSPEDIDYQLQVDNEIKAVVITYPSFYGICSDIKRIAEIVHKHNKVLIVDEAHGSHFTFNDRLPIPALAAGADISIQSAHKTLPALTQSSMVHVGSDRVNIEKLENMLSMYQTTSPSYILMASLDYARTYMEEKGKEGLDNLLDEIEIATRYLNDLDGVKVFDRKKIIEGSSFYDFDPTKFLVAIDGITGKRLDHILRTEYNIQVELSDNYYSLALLSISDETKDVQSLVEALEDISKKYKGNYNDNPGIDIRHIEPQIDMPIKEGFYKEPAIVNLDESIGRTSGTFIIPYPPGIPILCPGETITRDIIEYIKGLKKNSIQILGLLGYNEEKVKVIT